MQKAGRLVKILLLIQGYESITAEELAEKLEVSVRTIYRDIESLSLWGVPIIGESGHGGGYSLPNNYTIDPTMFNVTEASFFGIGSALVQKFTDFIEEPKELEIARAKLLSILPEHERLAVGRQMRFIYFDNSRWYRDYVQLDILRTLRDAVVHNNQILIDYHEREDPRLTEIITATVDAYGLVYKSDTWYLVGYSDIENQIRRWNITRIRKVVLTNSQFLRPPDFSLQLWWESEVEKFGKGDIPVLLRIDKDAWHRFQRFQWKKENRFFDMGSHIVVEMVVDKYEWLIDLVTVNRGDVEVLEPPQLREKIARLSKRILLRHTDEEIVMPTEADVVDFEILSLTSHDLD